MFSSVLTVCSKDRGQQGSLLLGDLKTQLKIKFLTTLRPVRLILKIYTGDCRRASKKVCRLVQSVDPWIVGSVDQ